jgi:fused signal recognition particle receptor
VSSTVIVVLVVVLVVVALAVVTGVVLARRRRIDLTERRPAVEEGRPAGYQAGGGIALAPGGERAVEAPPEPAAPDEDEFDVEIEIEVEPLPAEPVEVAPPAVDEIAPTSGRLEKLRGRLSRSRSALGQGLLGLLGAGDLDEDSWTEVEDTLLLADLGAATTAEVVERLRAELVARGVRTPEQARTLLREVLVEALHPDMDRAVRALPHGTQPAVVLVAGVNGTGKTTTTGKLARVLIADGRSVVLAAADTFRAAAADQLQTWAERVGAEVVRGREGADPAAVAFDAVKRGAEAGVDAVLVDTAGRLHTKTGLMDELGKVKRVVEKRAKVDEVLLVLDATTGQNGLTQARVFADVVDVTGIVLTKLDGTAKGGIVFQVQRELGVPVKLVGLGEGADDLAPFEPGAFVDALLG